MKHKYRTYKNGITGHRYKRYYIANQGRKDYSVLDPSGEMVRSKLLSYEDAEWEIDKITATPVERQVMEKLYKEDINTLQGLLIKAIEKQNDPVANSPENTLFVNMVTKIRTRKTEGKEF